MDSNNKSEQRTNPRLNSNVRRRRFLSKAGAVALTPALIGSAVAKKSDDPMVVRKRANKIRRNAGQRAWKKFLRTKGFRLTSTPIGMKLNEGDVGTQGFDNVDGSSSDCDICIEFSLYVDTSGVYTIDMFWDFDSEMVVGGGGYSPVDALGLYYNPIHWDYETNTLSGTTYTSNKGIVAVEDDNVDDGLPFVVDDGAASDDTNYWAGLNIVPVGDYSSAERYVYGEYVHTWNTSNTSYNVSVSFDNGVSITFDTNDTVKSLSTGTEGDGNSMMKINQSEATL